STTSCWPSARSAAPASRGTRTQPRASSSSSTSIAALGSSRHSDRGLCLHSAISTASRSSNMESASGRVIETNGAALRIAERGTDLPTSVVVGTAFVGFGAGDDGRHGTFALTSWTYSSGGQTLIDHSGGFASHDDPPPTG